MTRRISTLLLTTILAVSLFSVPLFAAKASTAKGTAPNEITSAFKAIKAIGGTDEPISQGSVSGKPSKSIMQSLGYQAVNGIVDLGFTTQYDNPANGSSQRQIGVGCLGNVISTWMDSPDQVGSPGSRTIATAYYIPGGAVSGAVGQSPAGGGFPALAVNPVNGTAILGYHRVGGGGTFVAVDGCAGNTFLGSEDLYPDTTNVVSGSTESGSNYIWPQIAADLETDGDWFVHVIAHESAPASDVSGYQSLVYWRSLSNGHQNLTAPLAVFIDTLNFITATVVAAPDQADQRVAIIYTKPRNYPAVSGVNDNIVYRESTDLGATWGPKTTIYNFANTEVPELGTGSGFERGAAVSGLYAADGCLHVLFKSHNAFQGDTLGGSVNYFYSRLRHWDKCSNQATLVADGFNATNSCLTQDRVIGKFTISECQNKLYAIFSKTLSDLVDTGEVYRDCSVGGFANYDIIIKASSTWGATWGPDSNVTKTRSAGPSYNCAAGNCFSEINMGSVEHSTDSLRVLYLEDKDAGSFLGGDADVSDNPIKTLSLGCFNMATFQNLTSGPTSFSYPFHTAPTVIKDTALILSNLGNIGTTYTPAISYVSGSGWLAFGGSQGPTPSGTVPVGVTNTENIGVRATGPATQGLYQANITFTYDSGTKVVTVPVDLYNFTNFYLPQNSNLRTSTNQLRVNQASQIAANIDGGMFNYFADDADTSYLYEGHLIIGNDALNLSYSVFGGPGAPSLSNPYGYTYAASPTMDSDSTTFATYRVASGKGVNRDTTIGFDVKWYASKFPGADSSDFYVGQFKVYKGSKNPAGSVSNLSIGYYTDWDIPSDSSENTAGSIPSKAAIWQRGAWSVGAENRYGATAAYRNDGTDIVGGWILDNPTYIYPESGYENDSLWNILEGVVQGTYVVSDSIDDLSGGVLIYRDLTINGATNDTVKFVVVIAGTRQGGLAGVSLAIDRAQKFLCGLGLAPGADICSACNCGDANGTGSINISDAVFVINYIFAGGAAPNPLCLGDANGTGSVNISDAVYIINFIFGGGPAPFCAP